jgi:hypothetical protein
MAPHMIFGSFQWFWKRGRERERVKSAVNLFNSCLLKMLTIYDR